MWVTAGTDVYGAVRRVDRTPIVTKFAMLQLLPIWPIESYYLSRTGKKSGLMIPLLGGHTKTPIVGLRLARVDKLSVLMSYVRALAAALALFGSTGVMFGLIFALTGGHADEFARIAFAVCLGCLALGVMIALPTYYFTWITPIRDQQIRRACRQWLGLAADMAQVDAATAHLLSPTIRQFLSQRGIDDTVTNFQRLASVPPDVLALQLLWMRTQLALGGDRQTLETASDELINALSTSNLRSQ